MSSAGRVLIVAHADRDEDIRIIRAAKDDGARARTI
jgi:hypothetical protein